MEKHDLLHEFPEHQDKIHQLKVENSYFRKLFDEYHDLDHQLLRIKTGVEIATDEALKELKAKALHLKDELYKMIKN
ncbi:MAG: DUF465 domain-containing protein [Flavobacterium sp.]|nr:DUF465 domain-containing protein [Flavobacterium sp.]